MNSSFKFKQYIQLRLKTSPLPNPSHLFPLVLIPTSLSPFPRDNQCLVCLFSDLFPCFYKYLVKLIVVSYYTYHNATYSVTNRSNLFFYVLYSIPLHNNTTDYLAIHIFLDTQAVSQFSFIQHLPWKIMGMPPWRNIYTYPFASLVSSRSLTLFLV